MGREREIVRASIVNIAGNVGLAITKGIVGTVTGSIAITLDAVNSLADACGSVIAIIGTKIAGRRANVAHPFGYGRVEYFAAIMIAAMILAAGISSLREAILSIIDPSEPTYTVVALVVVAVAALVKFGLGAYLIREGKRLSSATLLGPGTDAFMDGGVSCATCVAGILYMVAGWKVESWLAAIIALFIIRGGLKLLSETCSKLLGERVDSELAEAVEREVRSFEEVRLANGLTLMDFGPGRIFGTIHVTVDDDMTVSEFDMLARRIQGHVYKTCGVALTGVTPYPESEDSERARKLRAAIGRIVWSHDYVVDLRGLYVDPDGRSARLDAVVALGTTDVLQRRQEIEAACVREFPGWEFEVRTLPAVGD